MTNTKNSKRIWQEVKAKVRKDCRKDFHSYDYNNAWGRIGTNKDALAGWKYCLGGIDHREHNAERRILEESYERIYPIGFVELMYAGIVEITPNEFLGPAIEPENSHIRYPMDVFEGLQKRINGREFIFGYEEDTQKARFEGKPIDLTSPTDPYILRSFGVFAREILGNFPIEETLDAIKNVKKRFAKESGIFGKTKIEAFHTLEDYLNQEALLSILISENYKFSPKNYTRTKIGDLSHRGYIDHVIRNDHPPRKKVQFALNGGKWTYAYFTSDEYSLNRLGEKWKVVV